jgi:two-component system nitrate/nitrite sensor histidine kinase NarX
VGQARDVSRALDAVLDRVLALTSADIGAIYLTDHGSGDLQLISTRGLSESFSSLESRIPKGQCLCGFAATLDEPLIINDLGQDARLSRSACREECLGAMIGVPLRSRNRTLGVLALYASSKGAFAEVDRDGLQSIGWQLGTAVDNAAWAMAQRDEAVTEERRMIASELHDGVAQSLAYLYLQARRIHDLLTGDRKDRAADELNAVKDAVTAAHQELRQLLVTLRTGRKDGEVLRSSLHACVEAFEHDAKIGADLSGDVEVDRLSDAHRLTIVRMVQEALVNVRKHAQASRVAIACRRTPDGLEVTISDDGVGCDPKRFVDTRGPQIGTALLRERAGHLGGQVRFLTKPGEGTTVVITVPFNAPGRSAAP